LSPIIKFIFLATYTVIIPQLNVGIHIHMNRFYDKNPKTPHYDCVCVLKPEKQGIGKKSQYKQWNDKNSKYSWIWRRVN